MREIKFRAWDENIYGYHNEVQHIAGYIDNDSYTLEQYTGLKDNNGKEIYEGDMIEFSWNPFFNEPSEIFTFVALIFYYENWTCFCVKLQKNKLKGKQFDLFDREGIEEQHIAIGSPITYGNGVTIIGNIHQNPELLN